MSEHTLEPWKMRGHTPIIVDAYGEYVADCFVGKRRSYEKCIANARRIVACVNACDGVAEEDLSAMAEARPTDAWKEVHAMEVATLRRQLDRLLKACKRGHDALRTAVQANVDLPDFNPDDHVVVREMAEALAESEESE